MALQSIDRTIERRFIVADVSAVGKADIAAAKTALEETSTSLSKQMQQLSNLLATVGAGWSGEGAEQFKRTQKSLNDNHDRLRRMMDSLHEAVGQTSTLSSANDADVLASFKRLDMNGSAPGGHLTPSSGFDAH